MEFSFSAIARYGPYMIAGLYWTLALTGACVGIGTILGLMVCLCKISPKRPVRFVGQLYIQVFRNIPILVTLYWVYFCTGMFIDIDIKAIPAAIITFSLVTSAYMAEIFRAGIIGVSKGEIEAARALGMSSLQVQRRIVVPQAVRVTIPPFVNQIVATSKATTIASIIGVPELLYRAQAMSMRSYRPLELYTLMGVMFVAMLLVLSALGRVLERRLTRYR